MPLRSSCLWRVVSFSLLALSFSLVFSAPTVAASGVSGPSDSSRLDSLEAEWGHIRLGGEYGLQSDVYSGPPFSSSLEDGNRFIPGFNQSIKIHLEAQATPIFGLDLLMSHQGFWGVSNPSDGNLDKAPMTAPLLIDEAAIRYRQQQSVGDFGRFRFSLDPMGLITDHTSYPIEGMAWQTNVGGTYLGGYFSQVSTGYQAGNLHVSTTDDELALRIAWPRPTYLLGLTWMPTGLAQESAWGIDYTGWLGRHGFRMTAAHYTPSPNTLQQLNADGGWGFLAEGDLIASESRSLTLKLGYIQPGFTPTFSRLANVYTGTDGEPFSPDMQGYGLYYNESLNKDWGIAAETTVLRPIDLSLMTEAGRRSRWSWKLKAIRRFSPQAYLETGYESQATAIGRIAHLYAGLNLSF